MWLKTDIGQSPTGRRAIRFGSDRPPCDDTEGRALDDDAEQNDCMGRNQDDGFGGAIGYGERRHDGKTATHPRPLQEWHVVNRRQIAPRKSERRRSNTNTATSTIGIIAAAFGSADGSKRRTNTSSPISRYSSEFRIRRHPRSWAQWRLALPIDRSLALTISTGITARSGSK